MEFLELTNICNFHKRKIIVYNYFLQPKNVVFNYFQLQMKGYTYSRYSRLLYLRLCHRLF